jgi:SAM-dependent methyltransferase
MKATIVKWLQSHQNEVEEAIVEASERFVQTRYADRTSSNFLFDLKECERESLGLSRGEDLCYDRHTIGLSYALWYQGRRINTSMSFIIDMVVEAIEDEKPIELFDLGAGTGAIQVAVGLCLQAAKDSGIDLIEANIINVDISPFMLDFNRSFLEPAFRRRFDAFRELRVDYSVNSWMNIDRIRLSTPYIVASYLFDHEENQLEIAKYFEEIVRTYQPEKLVLLTSNQQNKVKFLNGVAKHIEEGGYNSQVLMKNSVFSGSMGVVKSYRERFNKKYGNILSTNTPSWDVRAFYAKIIIRDISQLPLQYQLEMPQPQEIDDLNLYIPPIKIRREIRLNSEQKAAAKHNNRPTIILGPAGCGKSVVITERIKNLCEEARYNPNIRILLTTFNKSLMSYLGGWLEDILDSQYCRRQGGKFYFHDSNTPNIELLHFDVLAPRIGKHLGILEFDNTQRFYISRTIQELSEAGEIDREQFEKYLDTRFLLSEYQRVIYGQQYDTPEKYQNGTRSGRPYPYLKMNSEERKTIWTVIRHYLEYLENHNKATIHTRRHKLLKDLREGSYNGRYTHIFVDEFQDCTQADYQIFYGLLRDNNNLVIAGDYAQAVHLGKTADIPREDRVFQGKERMGNRETKKLNGSFRLPFRISECIRPFSKHIKTGNGQEVDEISPYKGAPPGARPIVVYGQSSEDMKNKLLWIFWYFQVFDLFDSELPRRKKITILEKDQQLAKALNDRLPEIAETDTILKLKGMEKDCIVWSTRSDISNEDDAYYYIYTILTRTCSVLIIALFEDTPDYVYDVLSKMERKRLMFWDEASAQAYQQGLRLIEAA